MKLKDIFKGNELLLIRRILSELLPNSSNMNIDLDTELFNNGLIDSFSFNFLPLCIA